MKQILIISIIVLTLQGCSSFRWINDKAYEAGESMPTWDDNNRCEGQNFCW